jgi:hypothetical protein
MGGQIIMKENLMLKTKFFLAILAMTLVFGMTFTGCDDLNEVVKELNKPPVPVNVTAAATQTTITISWDAVEDVESADEGGYNVYRSNSEDGTYVRLNGGNWIRGTTYTDVALIPDTTYYYTVSASKRVSRDSYESDQSPPVDKKTDDYDVKFTTIAALSAWLASAEANNEEGDVPYLVSLNVESLGGNYAAAGSVGKLLRDNNTRFVSLYLSGMEEIEDGAFMSCTNLTSVTILPGVTKIGSAAFANSGITSIAIPSSVTEIGVGAFMSCASLTAINVDADNTAYTSGDGVLYNKDRTILIAYPIGKPATSFSVISSVETIGEYAFYNGKLTSVSLQNGLESIGAMAFANCKFITVSIPNTVANIDPSAFAGCTSLTEIIVNNDYNDAYFSEDGVLYSDNENKKTLVYYPEGKTGETFVIPDRVTAIGDRAVNGNNNLKSITIPAGVVSIGDRAFMGNNMRTMIFLGTVPGDGLHPDAFLLLGKLRDVYPSGGPGTYITNDTYNVNLSTVWERSI